MSFQGCLGPWNIISKLFFIYFVKALCVHLFTWSSGTEGALFW